MKTKLFFTVVVLSALTVIASGQTTQTAQQVQPGQGQVAANRGPGKGQGLAQGMRNGQGRHHGLAQGPGKRHPRGQAMMARGDAGRGQAMMAGRGAGRGQAMMAGRGAGRGQAMMAGRGAGKGQGVAPGRGLHNGQGPAFVDANKDGVCDNLVTTPEKK